MFGKHAEEQVGKFEKGDEYRAKLERAARHFSGSVAVVVDELDKTVEKGKSASEGQNRNGDVILGIVRDGVVTTIFPRRKEQDFRAETLRVDKVVKAKGAK